ncbi:MAG TPA: alternative ribosome rescue aminoacyl-tRNA hydrolase ArfB [Acetobacteraceae bacterium]|jgi:ribosome-associated protein|nr:alternative ribosome rescue aminoacyl-tRNA hydrolase ArfB [Acetobacteraceae bacterium]
MRVPITPTLSIDEREISVSFILGSGPGGQNVNKVATAAQLRFDARSSPSLPEEVRARLQALAGARLTREGVIVLTARRFRSQERNREDAVARLVALIRAAAERKVQRRETLPSRGERERRLAEKARRAEIKKGRRGASEG